MRRWLLPTLIALTASLLPVQAAEALTADSWADITWGTGSTFTVGEATSVTVDGSDLSSDSGALQETLHVVLRASNSNERTNGTVLATGDLTPEQPSLTLPVPLDTTGVRYFYVSVRNDVTGWRGDINGDWHDYTVVGHPSTISARLPGGSFRAGEKAVVTGRVSGRAGRLVQLQVKGSNGTWVPLAEGQAGSDGSYHLPAPTWFAANQTLRAYAPGTDVDAPVAGEASLIAVHRTTKPRRGTAFKYLNGWPARWDPCRPIRYRVNPRHLPAHGLRDLRSAFRAVSEATGLRFTYVGTTGFVPWSASNGPAAFARDADFAIAWTSPRVVPGLTGGTIGLGGSSVSWGDQDSERELTDGGVSFDYTQRLGRTPAEHRRLLMNLMLHEIGHAVGLGHVNDRREVMYPTLLPSVPVGYGGGDLAGLRRLDALHGCFPASERASGVAARFSVRHRPVPLATVLPRRGAA